MKKYELSEFRDNLVTEMNTFLYEKGSEYQVTAQCLTLNGVEDEYILVREVFTEAVEDDEKLHCGIALGVESLYILYMKGVSVKEIAVAAVEKCLTEIEQKNIVEDFSQTVTKEELLEHVSVRLIPNDKENQRMFSYARTWNDLLVALDASMERKGHKLSLCLTDDALEFYDISPDEAFEIAFNHVKDEDYILLDMSDAFIKAMERAGEEQLFNDKDEMPSMFLYSNERIFYGTKMIFNKQPLKELSKKLDSDLYLCPSSIHEWIIVSTKEIPLSAMTQVHLSSQKQLGEEIPLSDSIYVYKREFDTVGQASVLNFEKEV